MRGLIIAAAVGLASPASAAELTAPQVRQVLAQAGFNPGTSRSLGELGVYVLRSVDVVPGARPGEYNVKITITKHERN